MRVLVMGGTEFISLHLLRVAPAAGPRGHRLQPGASSRPAAPRRRARSSATGRITRRCRERLRGTRCDGVFDVTYAPTLREDVTALLRRPSGLPARLLRVHVPRLRPRAAHPLLRGDRRGVSTGATTPATRSAGEDVLLERHPAARAARDHRAAHPRDGPAQHPQQRDLLHGPHLRAAGPCWCRATAAGCGSSATSRTWPRRWPRCSATRAPTGRPTT